MKSKAQKKVQKKSFTVTWKAYGYSVVAAKDEADAENQIRDMSNEKLLKDIEDFEVSGISEFGK